MSINFIYYNLPDGVNVGIVIACTMSVLLLLMLLDTARLVALVRMTMLDILVENYAWFDARHANFEARETGKQKEEPVANMKGREER